MKKENYVKLVAGLCVILFVLPVMALTEDRVIARNCTNVKNCTEWNWTYPPDILEMSGYQRVSCEQCKQQEPTNKTQNITWTELREAASAPAPLTIEEVTGSVEFIIRAGGAVMSRDIYLVNDADPNHDWKLITIPMDGHYEMRLIPGNFTALMPDGNGGHAEWRHFTITIGDNKKVVFLGHAITMHHRKVPTVEPTPIPTVTPTPTPTPEPDTCYPVAFSYLDTGQDVTYYFSNTNREVKTVYVYPSEDYVEYICSRCKGCTPLFHTRVLPVSSWAAYPGMTEYPAYLNRMQGHITYQFRTETICEDNQQWN